jgi:uncharacterized protein (DUF1684 family)
MGVQATIGGKPVESAELRPDQKADYLALGDLTLYVHASGSRFAIRLRDKNSNVRKNFTGLKWFPVDESYRVTAKYFPYDQPKEFDSQNIFGDLIKVKALGYMLFTLRGQELRLEAEAADEGPGFFIVFRDLTSGKSTYPASRFLDPDAPKDGPSGKTVELDFNKARNPPCAYNPYTTCPVPVPTNRLRVEIPAGEKLTAAGMRISRVSHRSHVSEAPLTLLSCNSEPIRRGWVKNLKLRNQANTGS